VIFDDIIKGVPRVFHNKESNMSALTERYCSIQTLILPVLEEEFGVFSANQADAQSNFIIFYHGILSYFIIFYHHHGSCFLKKVVYILV